MDFNAAIKSVASQVAAVAAAPIPFVVLLSVLCLAVWQVSRWYYEGRISALEGRIAFKTDEVSNLKRLLADHETEQPSSAPLTSPGANEVTASERSLALTAMTKALSDSEIEIAMARGRFSDRNVPALRAAILSASKQFGIVAPYPVPENHGGPLTLGAGVALLRQVVPLLREGHLAEAVNISREMHDAAANRASPTQNM